MWSFPGGYFLGVSLGFPPGSCSLFYKAPGPKALQHRWFRPGWKHPIASKLPWVLVEICKKHLRKKDNNTFQYFQFFETDCYFDNSYLDYDLMNEQWQHVWLLLLHLLLLSKVLHTALSQADCSHRCHRCLDRCYLMVSFKSSSGYSISSWETCNVTANPWKYWALPCVSWCFLYFLVTFVSWWGKAPAFGALEDWTTDHDNDDDDAPSA